MGEELREVVTRFSYESDEKGAQKINRVVGGMKRNLIALGAVFGVGLSGKALADVGLSAEQAQTRLEGAAGAFDAKKIIEATRKVQNEFNALKKGAGDIITPAEGKLIGEKFFSSFGEVTKDNMAQFQTLLRASLAESIRTGDGVGTVFANMVENAKSGTIDALRGLPSVTEKAVREFENLTSIAVSPIDPTGATQLVLNMERFVDVLDGARPKMEAFVSDVSDPLITFRATGAEARKSFQNLGTDIVEGITPGLEIMRDLFKEVNDGIPLVDALANAIAKAAKPATEPATEALETAEGFLSKSDEEKSAAFAKFIEEQFGIKSGTGEPAPFNPQGGELGPIDYLKELFGFRPLPSASAQDGQTGTSSKIDINLNVNGEVRTLEGKDAALDAVGDAIDRATLDIPTTETP